jgi:hypothetical protein
MDTGTFAHT